MTLKDFLSWYVKESGRNDLQTEEGKKRFISLVNAAQDYLNGRVTRKGSQIWVQKELPLGAYILELTDCEVISGVYVTDSNAVRSPRITKKTMEWILENYPTIPPNELSTPRYYCIADREQGDNPKTLWLLPATDVTTTIDIKGTFKSTRFTGYTQTSFWITEYPIALMKALDYLKQSMFENTAGITAASVALESWIRIIDHFQAEEDAVDKQQFKGW